MVNGSSIDCFNLVGCVTLCNQCQQAALTAEKDKEIAKVNAEKEAQVRKNNEQARVNEKQARAQKKRAGYSLCAH